MSKSLLSTKPGQFQSGRFRTVHVFVGDDYPVAAPTYANGLFYGTTTVGGRYSLGTVYVLTP